MKKRFKKIYIEITNRCNLSCAFCPPTKRNPGMIFPREFAYILNAVSPLTDYICLHVKGEPLTHPHLDELLALAAKHNFYVNLTTNATLLGQKEKILLSRPIRQINLSLHSFEANTRLPGDMTFEEYVRSALEFSVKFSPIHGITAFRLWNLDPEKMSQPQFEKNRYILNELTRFFHLPEVPDYRNYTTTDVKLAKNTFLSFDHEFSWPDMDGPDFGPRGTCQGLKTHIAILWDGTVVPCCLDGNGGLALGNIFTQDIQEILASPKSMAISHGFARHEITQPLCRRCGYRTRF